MGEEGRSAMAGAQKCDETWLRDRSNQHSDIAHIRSVRSTLLTQPLLPGGRRGA